MFRLVDAELGLRTRGAHRREPERKEMSARIELAVWRVEDDGVLPLARHHPFRRKPSLLVRERRKRSADALERGDKPVALRHADFPRAGRRLVIKILKAGEHGLVLAAVRGAVCEEREVRNMQHLRPVALVFCQDRKSSVLLRLGEGSRHPPLASFRVPGFRRNREAVLRALCGRLHRRPVDPAGSSVLAEHNARLPGVALDCLAVRIVPERAHAHRIVAKPPSLAFERDRVSWQDKFLRRRGVVGPERSQYLDSERLYREAVADRRRRIDAEAAVHRREALHGHVNREPRVWFIATST